MNINIENCSFEYNEAKEDRIVNGGAIYNDGSGTITLTNSIFKSNYADYSSQPLSILTGDFKGGAVYSSPDIIIDGCYFENNYAKDAGGAIYTSAGITWGENPSTFKSNSVELDKTYNTIASKGGAIYAGKFNNNPKGLIFKFNKAGYGGAVYINNKNKVAFESCIFDSNKAKMRRGDSCGAAIYLDSSSSELSLIYNIFVDNEATEDKGVYNCGEYSTVKNNWWGVNNPNFDNGQLVEWHKFTSNDKRKDTEYLNILTSEYDSTDIYNPIPVTLKFVDKNGKDITSKLTGWDVYFSAEKYPSYFESVQKGDNNATANYLSGVEGKQRISAEINHQTAYLNLNINSAGDFATLQKIVGNHPGRYLYLYRNYTYSIGKDTITEGIIINKPLEVIGNGFTVNALGKSRIFNVVADNVIIENINLINGKAINGSAILVNNKNNVEIKNAKIINNTAEQYGGAIKWSGEKGKISDTILLNNKASGDKLSAYKTNETLRFTLTGYENYANAIYSENDIAFTNITYWNGNIVNGNNINKSTNAAGKDITLEVYDRNAKQVDNVTFKTDSNGQAIYNYTKFDDGEYTFKAYHPDNTYYTYTETKGNFTLTRIHTHPSAVKINIKDKKEFNHGECNISFEITNRTEAGVLITNADHTQVFYGVETDLNYVIVNLPARDEYYSIIVENFGNETYEPSSDTKLFKILKTNSTVNINPISEVTYEDNVSVKFDGDCESYNVTVYDKNNKEVFSQITSEKSINVSGLTVGTYTVTVTNLGNENKTQSKASTTFKVIKKDNDFKVSVDNVTYSNNSTITVNADVDGKYVVNINSTKLTINVVNGTGNKIIALGAGNYYAKVSFNNPNYNNKGINAQFIVEKARSNVYVSGGNISYGQKTIKYIQDDFPAEYNITILDSENNIVYIVYYKKFIPMK